MSQTIQSRQFYFIFFTHLPIEKNYSRDQINKSQESNVLVTETIYYKVLKPGKDSCLVSFPSVALLRNISYLKAAEILVSKAKFMVGQIYCKCLL